MGFGEHRCILAHADGTLERVQCDQRKIWALLGGSVTFAGSVGGSVVVVARAADDPTLCASTPVNTLFFSHRHLFFEDAAPPCGSVVFAGDADGEAAHVDEALLSTAGLAMEGL